MIRAVFLAACLATPALADVDEVLANHVQPGLAAFSDVTARLADAADKDCRAEALHPAWNETFDAWLGIQHLRLGPIEDYGLAVAFWPDARGLGDRTVRTLIADEDQAVETPEAFSEVSIAGRGLFAMERLLYDDDLSFYGPEDYACVYARAIATDLARMARAIEAGWREVERELRDAGEPGSDRFLTEGEARQALYTALTTGLAFDAETRIGQPLGTFERPRPERAEARLSGRSLRNVIVSLEALRDLAQTLAIQPIPQTRAAFDRALEVARGLDDPDLSGVSTVQGRFEVEILKQRIEAIQAAVSEEIGTPLGVSAGFNSGDGD